MRERKDLSLFASLKSCLFRELEERERETDRDKQRERERGETKTGHNSEKNVSLYGP